MFHGKKILILGVANEKSIAWAMAEGLHRNGAELILTYPNDAIKKRLFPLAEKLECQHVYKCDVKFDEDIVTLFKDLKNDVGTIDGMLHAIAFAQKEDLTNPVSQTSRAGFATALDISAYSLIALTREAINIMPNGGSILTLTYLGAQRAIKNYNIMGIAKAALEASVRYLAAELGEKNIRVNAISAGPMRTLASSAIPGFKKMLANFQTVSPLKRETTLEDLAGAALYFMGPWSSGVTGEISFVDCGYNAVGVMEEQ